MNRFIKPPLNSGIEREPFSGDRNFYPNLSPVYFTDTDAADTFAAGHPGVPVKIETKKDFSFSMIDERPKRCVEIVNDHKLPQNELFDKPNVNYSPILDAPKHKNNS